MQGRIPRATAGQSRPSHRSREPASLQAALYGSVPCRFRLHLSQPLASALIPLVTSCLRSFPLAFCFLGGVCARGSFLYLSLTNRDPSARPSSRAPCPSTSRSSMMTRSLSSLCARPKRLHFTPPFSPSATSSPSGWAYRIPPPLLPTSAALNSTYGQ